MLPQTSETIKHLLAVALGHFQAGRLVEAERAYREVLRLAPDLPGASYNLAVVLRGQGRIDEAVLQYRRTLRIQPGAVKAHNNLAVLLAGRGDTAEAMRHYREALKIQPDFVSAHYNLANLLREAGDLDRALDHYRRALAGSPAEPEINNNFGIALAARGRHGEAVEAYRRALAARPDYAEALSNLGSALEDLGRPAEAEAHYRKALRIKPDYADARFNLAHALEALDRPEDAEAEYELALALDPAHAGAHNNLGFLIQRQNRVEEALAHYLRAQEIKPGFGDAAGNEGLARLLLGDFDEGWNKYEGRWSQQGRRPVKRPLWDGGGLTGRTILLHPEQGLGDAIQFARYAPLVKEQGATVILECPPSLEPLFAGLPGVDVLVPAGSPLPRFDVHAPLLSLPRLLGTRLDSIPAQVPYLKADPALAEAWRAKLAGLGRPRIGFLWRGNPNHPNDKRRSMPVTAMAEVVRSLDAGWVNLQMDPREDELAALPPTYVAGPEIGDWGDTAALVDSLDLVVTVDTSTAHLAGAMGKPVWLLIPFAPDWRWMLDRSDSPWYPSMRIFRQPAPGDWASVVAAVREALRLYPNAPPPAAAPPPRRRTRVRPPAMVVSHERSGTHFLMNALSYGYGYTAYPWIDLDRHHIDVDYADPAALAAALDARAGDPLSRLVKSHHAAEILTPALARMGEDWRVFYIHREPTAAMVSLWRHLNGLSWDEGPKVADPLALARAAPSGQLLRYQGRDYPTMLRRWAGHVEGWLAAAKADPRITVVRYDDLDRRYEATVSRFAEAVGRKPATPLLRPPKDVQVIAMGKSAEEAPVSPQTAQALKAYCAAEVGELLQWLGY